MERIVTLKSFENTDIRGTWGSGATGYIFIAKVAKGDENDKEFDIIMLWKHAEGSLVRYCRSVETIIV